MLTEDVLSRLGTRKSLQVAILRTCPVMWQTLLNEVLIDRPQVVAFFQQCRSSCCLVILSTCWTSRRKRASVSLLELLEEEIGAGDSFGETLVEMYAGDLGSYPG